MVVCVGTMRDCVTDICYGDKVIFLRDEELESAHVKKIFHRNALSFRDVFGVLYRGRDFWEGLSLMKRFFSGRCSVSLKIHTLKTFKKWKQLFFSEWNTTPRELSRDNVVETSSMKRIVNCFGLLDCNFGYTHKYFYLSTFRVSVWDFLGVFDVRNAIFFL